MKQVLKKEIEVKADPRRKDAKKHTSGIVRIQSKDLAKFVGKNIILKLYEK